MSQEIIKQEAIKRLWHSGILTWKLDSSQRKIYETFKKSTSRLTVVSASRRIGKTTTLLVIALEYALQNPDVQIKYGAPTAKMVKKMIEPTLKMLMMDCPKELMPRYDRNEGVYIFKNGSKLFVEGLSEGNAENLRGTAMNLGIVDEAGFVPDLKYIINGILLPQALTTKGKIVIASTPPISSEHDFVDYMREAQLMGSFIRKTIYDYLEDVKNDPPHFRDRITPEIVEEFKAASGGAESSNWRREYICEILTSDDVAIVPEFSAKLKEDIVKKAQLPPHYDSYVSLDIGYTDFHAALFAYYDFKRNKLVIQDELLIQGRNTNSKKLAEEILKKEKALWSDPIDGVAKTPYMRIADDDMVTLNDLQQLHGITFIPTKKDNREASINELRIRLAGGYIEIDPRCENLLLQLEAGTWAKARDGSIKTTFSRSEKLGHLDLLAAMVYLVRNVHWNKNPYPAGYGMEGLFRSPREGDSKLSNSAKTIKDIFVRKK